MGLAALALRAALPASNLAWAGTTAARVEVRPTMLRAPRVDGALVRARFEEVERETDPEMRDKLAREMLEGTPVSQMAGGIGREGAGTLNAALAVLLALLCALTAASMTGAI
mmetsp:Transcript_12867/g.29187  ORF Transcript_12867/g.29187 Transcript_12867/m.29187 type:complete len:112 (-) Transcript_12867:115-450(-)